MKKSYELLTDIIYELMSKGYLYNKNYMVISETNNIVAEVDVCILKIYVMGETQTVIDHELLLYTHLNEYKNYKQLIYQHSYVFLGEKYDYALYKKINGVTLDSIELDNNIVDNVIQTLQKYIGDCKAIRCQGYGNINLLGIGEFPKFSDFISSMIFRIKSSLETYAETKFICLSIEKVLNRIMNDINEYPLQQLVPVDLNLRNFMLSDDGCIKIIDIGAVMSGPIELAYGEFMAHTYSTKLFDEFDKIYCISSNKLVRFFAIVSLCDILIYAVNHGIKLSRLCPFGNHTPVLRLIKGHLNFIQDGEDYE